MTGVPAPRPGISFFQRMFFVSLHSAGGFASFDTPVPSGPRHCGQNFSASAADCATLIDVMTKVSRHVTELQNLDKAPPVPTLRRDGGGCFGAR